MRIVSITVNAPVEAWTNAGFSVGANGRMHAGMCDIVFDDDDGPRGIRSWALAGNGAGEVCGIPTTWHGSDPSVGGDGVMRDHGVVLDHVMVQAANPSAVLDALEALGATDRSLAGGASTSPSVMIGHVRVDVLQADESTTAGAVLFGLAFARPDLASLVEELGPDVLGALKPATQPGWSVAAFRSGAGLGVPCALMSRS